MIETSDSDDKQETILEQWSPYLITKKARPGDVLLLRGSGFSSTGIAKATGGTYSHAMIILPVGLHDMWIAAEADHFGVGTTPMMPFTFSDPLTNKFISAVSIPNRPLAFQLYRHPKIEQISEDVLIAAANRLESREFYLSYSKLHRLIAPAPAAERLKVIAKTLVALIEKAVEKEKNYGTFCSELVAIFFENLGISLFDLPRPPELVSPNDLSDGKSHLIPVNDAFVELAEVADWTITKQFPEIPFDRRQILPYLVSNKRRAAAMTANVAKIVDIADSMLEFQLEQSRQLALKLIDEMNASEIQFVNFGDGSRVLANRQAIASVELSMRLLHIAYREYLSARDQSHKVHSYNENNEADGNSEDTIAQLELARAETWEIVLHQIVIIAATLVDEAQHKHLRLSIGFGLRVNAKAEQSVKSTLNCLRIKRNRAKFLRIWRNARTQHQIARDIKRDASAKLPITDDSDLALQLVFDAAIREIAALQNTNSKDGGV